MKKQNGRFVVMVTKNVQALKLKFDQVMFNSLLLTWERNFEVTFGIFLPWVRAFGFTRARRGKGKEALGYCAPNSVLLIAHVTMPYVHLPLGAFPRICSLEKLSISHLLSLHCMFRGMLHPVCDNF